MVEIIHASIIRGFETSDITEGTSIEILDTLIDIGETIFADTSLAPTTQASKKGNRSGNLLPVMKMARTSRTVDTVFPPNKSLEGSDMS